MLTTLDATTDQQVVLDVMQRDGAVILRDVIGADVVGQMKREVQPYLGATPMGRDAFTGFATQRTGALVARMPTCRALVLNDAVLGCARGFLAPYTDRIILHVTQIINIHPGQSEQALHRDRLAWGKHLPRSVEPQFNSIWALNDFTVANGATRVVPCSQTWDWKRKAKSEEIVQAEMAMGSVLLYTGSVIHGGGENRSNEARMGLNITFCLGWLRQEENQYLSCPPHVAQDFDPELQDLLGYTQGNYALGYYSDPSGPGDKSDIRPPEHVVGRKPRKGSFSFTESVP